MRGDNLATTAAPPDEDDVEPVVAPTAEEEHEDVDAGVAERHVELGKTSRDEADAGSPNEEDATPWTDEGGTLIEGATT